MRQPLTSEIPVEVCSMTRWSEKEKTTWRTPPFLSHSTTAKHIQVMSFRSVVQREGDTIRLKTAFTFLKPKQVYKLEFLSL